LGPAVASAQEPEPSQEDNNSDQDGSVNELEVTTLPSGEEEEEESNEDGGSGGGTSG
jgi:hypothetical protein